MSAQPERTGSGDSPTVDDGVGVAAGCLFSCAIESQWCAAGEIIVLRVSGEVDLCHVPILQAALDGSFDHRPAYLIVDLTRMPFCSARGLELLTQTGRTAAENATGYAVSGVLPQIDRVWTLCWDDDQLPVRYRSTAAAVTAIRCAESNELLYRGMPLVTRPDRKTSRPGLRVPPIDVPKFPSQSGHGLSLELRPVRGRDLDPW